MDLILSKEIQNLIDNRRGDTGRLEFILSSIQENKELYNSDQKFLIDLLEKYSLDENILDHLHFFNQDNIPAKETVTTFADNIQDSDTSQEIIYDHKSLTPKNKRNATVLAVVLGILGLGGIGHLYIRKTARGLGILFSNITVFLVGIAFFFFESFPIIDIAWEVPVFFSFIELIPLLLFFTNTGIFIWQIIDVRKLCKNYNDHFIKTQENLW
jgi:hypothetical protein